jgi:Ca-activated chloride channel family protein
MLALALFVALTMRAAPSAWASPLTAQDEYNKGEYSQAQRDYAESLKRDPASRLQFNLGAAAYKAHDFSAAASAFNNALKTRDIPLQQSAYYNLGNALFRQGEKGAATDPQTTMKTWQQSIGAYDTALQLQPTDRDAKFNRNVVRRRLEELQRQQQKHNDKNPQQKQQDRKDQQNQKDQQSQQDHPEQQSAQDQKSQPSQHSQQNQQNQQGQPNQQPQRNQPGQSNPPTQQAQQPSGPTQEEPGRPADEKGRQSAAAAAQDIGKPDQMSRLEAEQLLDSAKGEEGHLPIGMANGKPVNAPRMPLRDW